MIVTILGSGTSQGVPVIACNCSVCRSINPKDNRKRTSILIEHKNTTLVIDTGPDFRQQMLDAHVKDLDAVLFTHEHKDHVAGLDDVRAFNFKADGKEMDVYATPRVQTALKREFEYVFSGDKYPGIPKINLLEIGKQAFSIKDIEVLPIEVMHYKLPVTAFRFGNFAYVTDVNFISESEKKKLLGLDVLILSALRIQKHISHFNLDEAITLIQELEPKRAYLTHISHLMGKHNNVEELLPSDIYLCYDGLKIKID
ncbi:MAG: MBL fold metallo-hydrolase [Bacteroidetes bacterium]|nr:MAG: MBL fold metallo-hydrolase [Bacteroidota bacterium]MBL1144506.1 MBL fold metallo-hydrolase [Bacteroidota bacterium]MCB0801544.1 MBL fold metallo-hydrolase [Flavobacteriales bacterium]NOG57301.1 MBL fold metallo-hydrolase [Bacteroidota bacterium]